jgi:hypothetical protein
MTLAGGSTSAASSASRSAGITLAEAFAGDLTQV